MLLYDPESFDMIFWWITLYKVKYMSDFHLLIYLKIKLFT